MLQEFDPLLPDRPAHPPPESGAVPPSPPTPPATARATRTAPAVVPTRRPSAAGPGSAASDLAEA